MINILEILKKIPNLKDMVFYSPLYGDVKVKLGVYNECCYIEVFSKDKKSEISLTKYGTFGKYNGEPMLYPSRQDRDWSTFKVPRKDLPEDTSVIVSDNSKRNWVLRKYKSNGKCFCNTEDSYLTEWEYIIPVDKFNFKDWTFKEEDNYGTTHKS